MQENAQKEQCLFECVVCDELENIQGTKVYSGLEYDVIRRRDNQYIRLFKDHKEGDRVYAVLQSMPESGKAVISVLKGNEYHFDDTNNSFFHTGWEQFLIQKNRLILHASLLNTQFGGLIFSGPSGIGKSTQAELWKEYEGAEQINGDRPILYKKENVWMGYGSPYAGSSKCYVNKGVPVRAIMLLAQGEDCRIMPLRKSEAFREIFRNCTVYSWNREFVERVITLVTELVSDIPIYRLICTPDQRAVEAVKELLKKESEL
ncbi:MAG: hypothetical protein MR391_02015 [Dorea formicigenerans]|nr:hypothetical protein [Dorea formicigenerans]